MFSMLFTYWEKNIVDTYGQMTYLNPVLAYCHWETNFEYRITNLEENVFSHAFIFTKTPLILGSYIALGNHLSKTNPRESDEAFKIKQLITTPSVDETLFTFQAVI